MYHYVQDKDFLRRAQSASSRMLKKVEELLRKEYKINSQIFLVGSGARNMVTQNESESIDFDYNLNIISCPDWEKPRSIKESVRKAMNRIMTNEGLGTVNDSTSCLTTKTISFKDSPENKWSIDLCIVTKDPDGNWQRLIHEKTGFAQYDRYFWNTTPNSEDYSYKAAKIKECPGWWNEVRNSYLRIKNHYLQRYDYNHPSFVCYIEAVNEIYNRIGCRNNGVTHFPSNNELLDDILSSIQKNNF